jgi:hypothetical protein
MTGDGPARRFNLAGRDKTASRGVQPELAETDAVTHLGKTPVPTLLGLSVFCSFWLQHFC